MWTFDSFSVEIKNAVLFLDSGIATTVQVTIDPTKANEQIIIDPFKKHKIKMIIRVREEENILFNLIFSLESKSNICWLKKKKENGW